MTPTARRIMEKVRQLQPSTHEQWVQMHVDLALEEAAAACDRIKAEIYDDDLLEAGRLQACKEIAATILGLKSQEPAQ